MSRLTTATGELNTGRIQKELVTALKEDRSYRITDEAKKKHIATAASYDEFRHFVACADQKRVSNKDMESLAKPPKGWQMKTNLATGKAAGHEKALRSRRHDGGGAEAAAAGGGARIAEPFPTAAPKNPMAFERDWRRHCPTPELKLRYLALCGGAGLRKVFKTECDVALLGSVLGCLADAARAHPLPAIDAVAAVGAATASVAAVGTGAVADAAARKKSDDDDGASGGAADPADAAAVEAKALAAAGEVFGALCALPHTGRFRLNVNFMDAKDKASADAALAWLAVVAERFPHVAPLAAAPSAAPASAPAPEESSDGGAEAAAAGGGATGEGCVEGKGGVVGLDAAAVAKLRAAFKC